MTQTLQEKIARRQVETKFWSRGLDVPWPEVPDDETPFVFLYLDKRGCQRFSRARRRNQSLREFSQRIRPPCG